MSVEVFDKEAFKLVESIVDNSLKEYSKIYEENQEYERALFELNEDARVPKGHDVDFIENEDDYKIKNIKWPSIGEFTMEIGEHRIDEFIKTTWEYDNCWVYCIDYLEKIEKEFTNLYQYRARFSIPTRRKPVPRFTAHVYFTFDVSKIKPKGSTVNVYFVVETQRLVHQPGFSRFRQQWLNDILANKEALIKDINF